MSEVAPLARFLMRMKQRKIVLYVGIIHSKTADDDAADIAFILDNLDEAIEEMKTIKRHILKSLNFKEKYEYEGYCLLTNLNETEKVEVFFVERIIVIKGDNQP